MENKPDNVLVSRELFLAQQAKLKELSLLFNGFQQAMSASNHHAITELKDKLYIKLDSIEEIRFMPDFIQSERDKKELAAALVTYIAQNAESYSIGKPSGVLDFGRFNAFDMSQAVINALRRKEGA